MFVNVYLYWCVLQIQVQIEIRKRKGKNYVIHESNKSSAKLDAVMDSKIKQFIVSANNNNAKYLVTLLLVCCCSML